MKDEVILDKLDEQAGRLKRIETTMAIIAVQDEKIASLQSQVGKIWDKYDKLVSPDGIIAKVNSFQGACPKDDVKTTVTRQWAAIGLLATIVTGTLLKALGLV